MAKFELKKDKNRKKNIEKTEISKPKDEFSLDEYRSASSSIHTEKKSGVGRPAQNKEYTSLRIQKKTSFTVNAMVNVLEMESVDELISVLIEEKASQLSTPEKTMFDMYVRTYQNRSNKRRKK